MTKRAGIFLLLIVFCSLLRGQTYTNHSYDYNDSIFNNPERGFYKYTERSSAQGSLDQSLLNSFYDQGFTVIYRIFYLPDFVNSPISQAYLDKIREDFARMREAGIKGVVRFAYTASMIAPYGDATPEQVKVHISQLKPILIENSDVILVLQAGFIGAWGEWYYTDYFATGSPNNVTKEDLQERKSLVNSLLDALPKDRMIQVRYVGYKMKLFDSVPVGPNDAYSGSPKSRISHHNDCFVSSENDVGSYQYMVFEKNYLEKDTKYTSIGGETCALFETRSNCDTSTYEMKRFHWSFINQDYYGQTINEWVSHGCYSAMQKNLGYRYFLTSSKIQDATKPSGSLSISFKLTNMGYSNPINPRTVKIILRNILTGRQFYYTINTDIRKKELNSIFELSASIGIPSYIPEGDYAVFLNLSDSRSTLAQNPKFAVQLANKSLWEKSTGYNSLNHIVHITNAYSGGVSATDGYFAGEKGDLLSLIKVDGNGSEWNFIPRSDSSAGNLRLKTCKVVDSGDTLFFLVSGTNLYPNTQLFIDWDMNSGTGMNYWIWSNDSGIDFLVQNNQLFKYAGVPGSDVWNWKLISDISESGNTSFSEIAIPKKLLNGINQNDSFLLGFKTVSNDWSTGEYLPVTGSKLLKIKAEKYISSPQIMLNGYCQNAIISFAPEEKDTSSLIIIERRSATSDPYKVSAVLSEKGGTISFSDQNLEIGKTFDYRVYRTNEYGNSSYSDQFSYQSRTCNFTYPEVYLVGGTTEWNPIHPVGGAVYTNSARFLKAYCTKDFMNILITGDSISEASIYLDTDDNIATGQNNPNWKNTGYDFKFNTDHVYTYTAGQFSSIGNLDSLKRGEGYLSLKVPLGILNLNNSLTSIHLAAEISGIGFTQLMPYAGWSSLLYERTLPAEMPANFAIRRSVSTPGSKLIVTWDKCNDCEGYVLTRTNSSTNEQSVFSFKPIENQLIDNGLSPETWYEYSIYSYNFAGPSDVAGPISLNTLSAISPVKDDAGTVSIFPDPARNVFYLGFQEVLHSPVEVEMFNTTGRLVYQKYLPQGIEKAETKITINAERFERGIYFISIKSGEGCYQRKIVLI
jgi:hypothetical protein